MEPAGHGVGLAAELPTGMQRGQDDLERGPAVLDLRDGLDGDPAPVIGDPAASISHELDYDLAAVSGQRLVDGVVDDLVDQVVEAPDAGGPDVHPGAPADGLQPLKDRDVC
jgi:hypothetical protein